MNSAQVYTLSPAVTPGPRARSTVAAPVPDGRRRAVVAARAVAPSGGSAGPEEGVGALRGDRRRMGAALLLATALNATLVLLPADRGPGEEGSGPPPAISVLLAAPAAPPGQGTAASLEGAAADELRAEADAAPAPVSNLDPQPVTRSPGLAPEPGLGEIPPEESATAPTATVAHLEPSPTQPSPAEPASAERVPMESSVAPAPRPAAGRATRPKPAGAHAAAPPGRSARKVAMAGPSRTAPANPGVTVAHPSGAGQGTLAGAGVPSPALDTEAVPIVRVAPVYPVAARTSGTEGRVLVEFTILADGSVTEPTVVDASPAGVFDRAVLQAIRQWRFAPRVEDGQAVSRRARQTVRFSLSS